MPDTFTSGDIASAVETSTAAAEASPAPQTSEQVPASAPTTEAQPATTVSSESTDAPIPHSRHKDILERTRTDYESKLSRLSWAESLDRDRVQRALALAELQERQPAPAAPEAPQPDLRTEDGLPLYSAKQAAALARYEAEQAAAALEAKFAERFGPVAEGWSRAQQNAAIADQIDEASTWPGFSDHMEAITNLIAEAAANGRLLTLEQAYIRTAAPSLAQSRADLEKAIRAEERKAVLAEINQTSAAVSDTVNPSRRPASTLKADHEKTWGELLEEEFTARSR